MELSSDLISEFVKVTNDSNESSKETTVNGTVVSQNGDTVYVRLDGSDSLTPATSTAKVMDGERVMILLKDHKAVITGNISSPAARDADVEAAGGTATDFMRFNSPEAGDGLVVGNFKGTDTLGGNVQLTGEPAVNLRNGDEVVATFTREEMSLSPDYRTFTIDGAGIHMFQRTYPRGGDGYRLWTLTGYYTDNENHDYVKLSTKGTGLRIPVVMETDSFFAVYARNIRFAEPNSNAPMSNIYGLGPGFYREDVQISTGSISANGYKSTTTKFETSGYPIAIAGFSTDDSDIVPYRMRLDEASAGGGTIGWAVKNTVGSSQSATVHVYVLCTK